MQKIIRLCYRKIIDTNSSEIWDRNVFESTHAEYLLQSQFYNQEKKYNSFKELLLHNPAADKLHFLVSAAVTGYLQQLGGRVPDISDVLGKPVLTFTDYRFEIIQSHAQNKGLHQVAIYFFSNPLVWHASMGNQWLVSAAGAPETADGILTWQIAQQPFLSIFSLKETAA